MVCHFVGFVMRQKNMFQKETYIYNTDNVHTLIGVIMEGGGVFPFRLIPFCLLLLPFRLLPDFTLFPFRLLNFDYCSIRSSLGAIHCSYCITFLGTNYANKYFFNPSLSDFSSMPWSQSKEQTWLKLYVPVIFMIVEDTPSMPQNYTLLIFVCFNSF